MTVRIIHTDKGKIALVNSDTVIISDGQSALDFVATIGYEHDCRNIAVNKAAIIEDFFRLSTGVAGEVAQKFVNYRYRVAVIGDFSIYTSQPLRDYIFECNRGRHIFFVSDENEAIRKLEGVNHEK